MANHRVFLRGLGQNSLRGRGRRYRVGSALGTRRHLDPCVMTHLRYQWVHASLDVSNDSVRVFASKKGGLDQVFICMR